MVSASGGEGSDDSPFSGTVLRQYSTFQVQPGSNPRKYKQTRYRHRRHGFLLSGTTNGFRVPLRLTEGCGLRDSTLPNEDGGGKTNHG